MNNIKNSKGSFSDAFLTILKLEWMGIRIENAKEERDCFDDWKMKTVFYFSVPESSTIEAANEELNSRMQTADGLIAIAKEELIKLAICFCSEDDPLDQEVMEELTNNTADYIKFYAKIRKEEIWNKERGDNRVKQLIEYNSKNSEYKDV